MPSTAFCFKSIGLSFTFSETLVELSSNMFIVIPVSEAFMNLSLLSLVLIMVLSLYLCLLGAFEELSVEILRFKMKVSASSGGACL